MAIRPYNQPCLAVYGFSLFRALDTSAHGELVEPRADVSLDGRPPLATRRVNVYATSKESRSSKQRAAMLTTDRVPAIFADARSVHADALRMLEAGDIRDAAENAWCATKRATDALVLARTGTEPEFFSGTSRGLLMVAEAYGAVSPLIGRYYSRQGHLHGDCFYHGICEPIAEVHRRIYQTSDYINDAERLAGYN